MRPHLLNEEGNEWQVEIDRWDYGKEYYIKYSEDWNAAVSCQQHAYQRLPTTDSSACPAASCAAAL